MRLMATHRTVCTVFNTILTRLWTWTSVLEGWHCRHCGLLHPMLIGSTITTVIQGSVAGTTEFVHSARTSLKDEGLSRIAPYGRRLGRLCRSPRAAEVILQLTSTIILLRSFRTTWLDHVVGPRGWTTCWTSWNGVMVGSHVCTTRLQWLDHIVGPHGCISCLDHMLGPHDWTTCLDHMDAVPSQVGAVVFRVLFQTLPVWFHFLWLL